MSLIPVRLSLCDDCCCGTERKHPDVDHAGIRARLAAAAESIGGRSRSVGCLDVCERSNVVVVKTRHAGSFWVGGVLDEPIVCALESWVRQGAPLPVPATIAAHLFERPSVTPEPEAQPVVEFVSLQRSAQR